MSLTRSYVEKLIAVRDAYEREKGPDDNMDKLVNDKLFELLMSANVNVETVNWCKEQLANERRRTALYPESLIRSGMIEPRKSYTLQEYLKYLQDLRDELRFYDNFGQGGPHAREMGGGKTHRHRYKKGKKGKKGKSIRRGKH